MDSKRDDLIRKMMERKKKESQIKKEGAYKKNAESFYSAAAKIVKKQEQPKIITNSYGIKDPNLCPDIARGEAYILSLNEEAQKLITNYTGSGYMINQEMRGKVRKQSDSNSAEYWKRILDKAFDEAPPLEAAMTVYRGVGRGVSDLNDLGYASCSLNENVSKRFGGGKCFKIVLPAGSKILFICVISYIKPEMEVLINRVSNFEKFDGEKVVYENGLSE